MDAEVKAGTALATAISGATMAWLEFVNLVVSISAGIAALIASGFAIYWYIRKGRPEK